MTEKIVKISLDRIIVMEDIKNWEREWKANGLDLLEADIKKNGLKEPLKVFLREKNDVQTRDFNESVRVFLADGSHRYMVLKKLGWKEVPCIILGD